EKNQGIFLLLLFIAYKKKMEPTQASHVHIRSIKDVETLNPVVASGKEASSIISLIYQPLLSIDLGSNEIKPILANQLPKVIIEDSVSHFHYTLRPEATWPDGSPITAYDVFFTLKVANAPHIQNERRKKIG